MFKLTVCLLLCTAVFSVEVQNYFENCVRSSGNQFVPNKCIMVSKKDLRTKKAEYRMYAVGALRKHHELDKKYSDTVYNVTRAALKYPRHADEGCTLRLEFLTAPGDCKNWNYYFPNMCPPANDKITGVCQAQLFLYGTVYLVERSWCEHVKEASHHVKSDSSSGTP
uniref:Putative cystatin-like 1 protein n=1 Tax=Rhipicephalus microplus TaxID=6941 RepID=A0A6M2D3S7_RHIMP